MAHQPLALCPLGVCDHAAVAHDGDGDDEPFRCCADKCGCHGYPEWRPPRPAYETLERTS